VKLLVTKIAFLGSVIPEDYLADTPAVNVGGNIFQTQLIESLRSSFGTLPVVISSLPIATYPGSSNIFVAPSSGKKGRDGYYRFVPFVNLLFMKQLSVCIFNFVYLSAWQLIHRRNRRIIIIYNTYPPIAIAAIASKWIFGGKVIAIVLDFPHNLAFDGSGWKGFLQRMVVKIEALCLARFDAIISATRYIAEDFGADVPVLVMEGGADVSEENVRSGPEAAKSVQSPPICLFSGTLYEGNGIGLVLDSFAMLMDHDLRLWIFGKGPLEARVREAVARDKRIVYWGHLPHNEVKSYQKRATVLLNPRPSNQLITRYTFPSKLREYLLSGRPVITTILAGIPEEYYEFVYKLEDETPAGLAKRILEICSKSERELDEFGRRAQDFIRQKKNWTVQGKRIYEFINRI
jgi:hypothetical protein